MIKNNFKIGSFTFGQPLNPYVIAEIGVNHEGSLELAKKLIELSKEGGAHAAKFQTYKAEKIASRHSPAYWDTTKESTQSQYELFKKYDSFGEKEYKLLAEHCHKVGIEFMSTPFDLDAIDFLDPLVKIFKIASADITNVPLLRKIAKTGKPLILSTGASSIPEMEHAREILVSAGAKDLTLLHCVLNYPTGAANAQMNMIPLLQKTFTDCWVGYSDHVPPDETLSSLEMATLLGAVVLEKHFTHDKSLPGNDHYHAANADDLKTFMRRLEKFRLMYGKDGKDLSLETAARTHARRSIVAHGTIRAGEKLTEKNLIVKRPAHGISPIYWDDVLGSAATVNIEEDRPITWQMISTRAQADGK